MSCAATSQGSRSLWEPNTQDLSRKIDRRLTWAIREVAKTPSEPSLPRPVVELMRDTAHVLSAFLDDYVGPDSAEARCAAERAVAQARRDLSAITPQAMSSASPGGCLPRLVC